MLVSLASPAALATLPRAVGGHVAAVSVVRKGHAACLYVLYVLLELLVPPTNGLDVLRRDLLRNLLQNVLNTAVDVKREREREREERESDKHKREYTPPLLVVLIVVFVVGGHTHVQTKPYLAPNLSDKILSNSLSS
jgi:hypothetical protein